VSKSNFADLKNINFSLILDGEIKQQGNTSLMLFDFDVIISYISKFIWLKEGDIIFTGTPKGVGPVQIGNRLEAYIEDKKMLKVEIK
jgi:2-keto-4-pentenoate hydratase/2-oxohepta-3-ene-1,7-dioic acid hydratase in catechol pathway